MEKPGLLNFNSETGYVPLDWFFPDATNTSVFYQLFTKDGTTMSTVRASDPLIVWIEGWPVLLAKKAARAFASSSAASNCRSELLPRAPAGRPICSQIPVLPRSRDAVRRGQSGKDWARCP